jgi:hypothetical protein
LAFVGIPLQEETTIGGVFEGSSYHHSASHQEKNSLIGVFLMAHRQPERINHLFGRAGTSEDVSRSRSVPWRQNKSAGGSYYNLR